jgi:hypothetical protein
MATCFQRTLSPGTELGFLFYYFFFISVSSIGRFSFRYKYHGITRDFGPTALFTNLTNDKAIFSRLCFTRRSNRRCSNSAPGTWQGIHVPVMLL